MVRPVDDPMVRPSGPPDREFQRSGMASVWQSTLQSGLNQLLDLNILEPAVAAVVLEAKIARARELADRHVA